MSAAAGVRLVSKGAGLCRWLAAPLVRYGRLVLFLFGLFGWIDSIPLFGPVGAAWAAARGVPFGALPLWFLAAHGVSLVLWGTLVDRRPQTAPRMARFALLAAAALTVALWRAPAAAWPALFVAMGAATAAGVVVWGRWYATAVAPGWLGRTFALVAGALALLTSGLGSVVHRLPVDATLLGTLVLLGAAWAALAMPPVREGDAAIQGRTAAPRLTSSVVRLALFIAFFSLVAGLSYQVIVVAPLTPYADDTLRLLPYVAGVLACGVLADRGSLKLPLLAGASLLALAFLIGAWGEPEAQYAALVLNGTAFGLLEATPWLLLASRATPADAGRWFGWGLNLNVVPIFLGAALTSRLRHLDPAHVGLLAAVALILAMASLQGADDPVAALRLRAAGQPDPPEDRAAAAPPSLERLFELRYGAALSPREVEVGRFAVLGVGSVEIARTLFISENTVKTHLRHVYRKTGTSNRTDLLRRLLAATGDPE